MVNEFRSGLYFFPFCHVFLRVCVRKRMVFQLGIATSSCGIPVYQFRDWGSELGRRGPLPLWGIRARTMVRPLLITGDIRFPKEPISSHQAPDNSRFLRFARGGGDSLAAGTGSSSSLAVELICIRTR